MTFLNMKKEIENRAELFICKCENPEHQVIFRWLENLDNDVYMSVHLRKLPFRKRLIYGIKYIFGHTSRYGAFDEFIFQQEDAGKLEVIVKHMRKNYNPIRP